jgi:hypothetical protein
MSDQPARPVKNHDENGYLHRPMVYREFKFVSISLARRQSGFFRNPGSFGNAWKFGLGCG